MLHLHKKVLNYFKLLFVFSFFINFTSCSSLEKEPLPEKLKERFGVQLKEKLMSGISLHSGDGSQEEPFKIIVDESVYSRKFLSPSHLFSNVTKTEEYATKVGEAELHSLCGMIVPSLHSKLPLKLKSDNDEKYAELYFQGAARLTKDLHTGEAVLQSPNGAKIVKNFEEIDVIIYHKSLHEAGSVELKSLFDKQDLSFFTVKAFKIKREAEMSINSLKQNIEKNEPLNFSSSILKGGETVLLQFEPKEGVDSLLYPRRSQILKAVSSPLIMSSLKFKKSMWSDAEEKRTQGAAAENPRLIKSAWDEELDLSSYLEIKRGEFLKAKLYSINNLRIITSAGESFAANQELNPQAVFNSNRGYKFDIFANPAAFVMEFIGSGKNLVEKRLYIKVLLTLPSSPLSKADFDPHILAAVLDKDKHLADGSKNKPYEFDVETERIQPSELVTDEIGDLIFEIKNLDHTSNFIKIDAKTSLGVHPGALEEGNIPAGSWLLRITDLASARYKEKSLYFKLNFVKQASSLEVLSAKWFTKSALTIDEALEISIAAEGELILSHLTTAIGRKLQYRVAQAGTALTQETVIENAVLEIGSKVGEETLKEGSFVLSVSDHGTPYTLEKTIFFKLNFESKL